jgi:hypothetical protein
MITKIENKQIEHIGPVTYYHSDKGTWGGMVSEIKGNLSCNCLQFKRYCKGLRTDCAHMLEVRMLKK